MEILFDDKFVFYKENEQNVIKTETWDSYFFNELYIQKSKIITIKKNHRLLVLRWRFKGTVHASLQIDKTEGFGTFLVPVIPSKTIIILGINPWRLCETVNTNKLLSLC